MKKLSLFLLVVLFGIGSLRAQTREESINSHFLYQEQAGQLPSRGDECVSAPLMMGPKPIEKTPSNGEGSNDHGNNGNNDERDREDGEGTERDDSPGSAPLRSTALSSSHDPTFNRNQAGSPEAIREDSSDDINDAINTAKNYLESSRAALATINKNLVNPGLCQEEVGGLQGIVKKRHDDFLFQEAFSNQHAQLQAQENADFFSAKLQDIQRSVPPDREEWLLKEEPATQDRVELFRESLRKVAPVLQNIKEAYEQLSNAYAVKAGRETEDTGERNVLSLFESDEITVDDQRVIVGQYGVVTLVELSAAQDLLMRWPQIYKDGINLVRIAVMKNFGIGAVKRFDETFHVSSIYSDPLTAGMMKEFIELEHVRAQITNPDAPKSYFFSAIDSLTKIGRLSETEKGKLIRSNGHQLHFNPFSGEEPSSEHVTDDEDTAWEGVIAVRESLKEEDFFKGARALQQRDILKRFDEKFLGDKKNPLTIEACNTFVKAEREKSKKWRDQLYYRCFSNSHEINQTLWSWFAGIVSGERAQPPFTDVHAPLRSLVISVASAYAMNALNDVTRPYRKPAKDDGIQSARAKEAVLAEDANKNLYKDFSTINAELEVQKQSDLQQAELLLAQYYPAGRHSLSGAATPNRAKTKAIRKINKSYQDSISKIAKERKTVAIEKLQKLKDQVKETDTKNSAQEFINSINGIAGESLVCDQVQRNIDTAFQFLVDHSSQIVAEEREHLESIHQSLDLLSQEDFSRNLLCSSAEVETMQRLFEETKASFLLQQARFHENAPDMNQLQQIAAKNAALFFDKTETFKRKVDGGARTVSKVESQDQSKAATIRSQLDSLNQLKEISQQAGEAYDQLSKIYSLRIARPSEAGEGEIAPLNLADQLMQLKSLGAEQGRNVIVSRNGKLELIEPHRVKDAFHTALKQNGISLVRLALFDAFGKEGVEKFNNSIQFKTSGKKPLTLKELQNFLASNFIARGPSYFLSLGHSVKDLLGADASEDGKVIRSNGRTFVYNPFSPKDASKEYLLSDKATAQEGVAAICASLAECDFFKKATKLNQYNILKRFCQQFQGEMAKPLTVGAFKDFVKEEESNSKTWGHYFYYRFYDPYTLSQEWAGFMGFVTGARFQHPFKDWDLSEKFALTWIIDVLGEYNGQYREYRDGGIYHKLVAAALSDIHGSSAQSGDIPNFEERLQEALEKKEAQQSSGNAYQYVVASQKYEKSVQEILAARKLWVTKLLEKRSAALAAADPKKATFTQALDEINTTDAQSLEQRVREGMDLLTKDTGTATAEAMTQLENLQQSLSRLANGDPLSQNILFSKKDLEALQQTLRKQVANLGLEQLRLHQNPLEIAKVHASVARNADFFFKKISDMEAMLDGGYAEIMEQVQDEPGMMKQLSFFNKLRKELKTAALAYDQLADAYSLKMMLARREVPQERENFISYLEFHSGILPSWRKILIDDNGHLAINNQPDVFIGLRPSEQDRFLSAAALPLLKLEITDALGEEALHRFESQIKVKILANHPLTVGDVQQLIESERTQHNNLSAFYLSAGHSLEEVLHASKSENSQLLRSHGSQFRYNPFAEGQREKADISRDKKTDQEGVNVALKGLREMEFFKKLTRLNQEYVMTHFEERFKTPKRTWVQFLRSFVFEEKKKKPEALTVGAFKSFVQSEIQASEEWKNTYHFLDNPLYTSIAWNIVAGAGVIARIDPRVINCTPIDIAFRYGGHRYLVHTITALTIFPHALHAVPSILISYGINRVAESWLHLRQRSVPSPIE